MVSLGQGGSWIGRNFLVNLCNGCTPEIVADLDGPWNTSLWFPLARVDIG